MTVSKLCTYTHLTSKCNSRSGSSITRITPHQMSAHWTGKQCADYFCSTSRQASANYCIGYDGDIAQNVDETMRAWTSSSWDNDRRAITIELSNSASDTARMTDATIKALEDLCVDLLQRYPSLGGKLVWTGDTDGNITFHKWFADTDCPGWYLEKMIPSIVEHVNERLHPTIYKVCVWNSNGNPNQKWKINEKPGGLYEIESCAHPGFVLDVTGYGTTDGTQVILYRRNNQKNQLWRIETEGIISHIEPAHCEGMRLDVKGAVDAPGTLMEIWSANNSDAQRFIITNHDSIYQIINDHRNKKLMLDVVGG